jgi:hypothetical protein
MKTRSPIQPSEQVKFWRDPALNNTEMLRATYVTHSFSRHTHEGYAIGVIDAGVEEFTYQGATHRAIADSIVIVHPGEVHTGRAGTAEGWQYRMLYPEVKLLQQAIAELQESTEMIPYFPNPVIQDAQLAGQLRRLHMALEAGESQLEREADFALCRAPSYQPVNWARTSGSFAGTRISQLVFFRIDFPQSVGSNCLPEAVALAARLSARNRIAAPCLSGAAPGTKGKADAV